MGAVVDDLRLLVLPEGARTDPRDDEGRASYRTTPDIQELRTAVRNRAVSPARLLSHHRPLRATHPNLGRSRRTRHSPAPDTGVSS